MAKAAKRIREVGDLRLPDDDGIRGIVEAMIASRRRPSSWDLNQLRMAVDDPALGVWIDQRFREAFGPVAGPLLE